MMDTYQTSRRCALVLLLVAQSIVGRGITALQVQEHSNCSLSYNLTVGIDGDINDPYCLESYFQSSPHVFAEKSTLKDILELHGTIIGPGDCLELVLSPGDYTISPLSHIMVNYSIVISAPEGGVNFECVCDRDNTTKSSNASDGGNFTAMIAFNGSELDSMTVQIEGVNFYNCSRWLQFDELESIRIENCSFVGFSASALDILDIKNIEIESVHFEDCISNIHSNQHVRAHAGALSIAYSASKTTDMTTTLNISKCTFVNNAAYLRPSDNDLINSHGLTTGDFFGRGGGLSIITDGFNSNVNGYIKNCEFTRNKADSFGGGAYLLIRGNMTRHRFTFEGCTFIDNHAYTAGDVTLGGGIQIPFLNKQNQVQEPSEIAFIDSHFERNSATYGGGLSAVQVFSQGHGNKIALKGTTFKNNTAVTVGGAVMFQTFAYVQNRFEAHFYSVTGCSFAYNKCPGGVFGARFTNINFFETSQFRHNIGPALRLVGGLAVMNGSLSFVNNTVLSSEGGALYSQAFGQVMLRSGAHMEFINNTGRIGSAIVVDVQRSSRAFSEVIYNPQCFLIHENGRLPPGDWDDVSIRFSGNRAEVGPVLYSSHLFHCSWLSETKNGSTIFDVQQFSNWAVFKYDETNAATAHGKEQNNCTFYFQTQPVKIVSNSFKNTLVRRPGQTICMDLKGMDQFDNPTYLIARLSDSRSSINSGAFTQAVGEKSQIINTTDLIRFEPALLPILPNIETVQSIYGFVYKIDLNEVSDNNVKVVIDTPYNILLNANLTFQINFTNCLPGYELRKERNTYGCYCIENQDRSNFHILNCEEDVLLLRSGTWATDGSDSPSQLNFIVCPAPYCRCYTRRTSYKLCETLYYIDGKDSSSQCYSRNGTLCGQCVNGTGIGVLRNNCRKHTADNNLFAMAILVLCDFIIITLLILATIRFNLHFPHSLRGVLFYIQTAYYTTEHFPISFWDIRKYMLFVSSALGLYFPYDFSLYPSMSALVSFGLKFIPSAIAVTVAVTIAAGAYITKNRIGRKYVWKAIWTLTLLLYAPLLHTCVSLLECPLIPSETGMPKYHWLFDGTVVCFEDSRHIILGILAIVVLILLVLAIPVLFFFIIITRFRRAKADRSLTVEWILCALTEGYRDSYEAIWWAPWELFRRFYIIIVVTAFPGRSVIAANIVIIILSAHIFFKPYKKTLQNVTEAVILLNYAVFLLIRSTQNFLDANSSMKIDNITLSYTGTEVPDYVQQNGLSSEDIIGEITWIFLPFFYWPLVIAIIYSLGATIYYFTKCMIEKIKAQKQKWSATFDVRSNSSLHSHKVARVTTTVIDGPSL